METREFFDLVNMIKQEIQHQPPARPAVARAV